MELVHQVILNTLVTKDISNKIFDFKYPWGETLSYIAWATRSSYHCTIQATSGQGIFGSKIIINLSSVSGKQQQVDIGNVQENTRWVTHDNSIGNIVHVEITGIYRKLDYKKQWPYIITKVFTSGTVRVQQEQVNERINSRQLMSHSIEKSDCCP